MKHYSVFNFEEMTIMSPTKQARKREMADRRRKLYNAEHKNDKVDTIQILAAFALPSLAVAFT